MTATLTDEEFDGLLERFTSEAFRHEVLPGYAVDSDGEDLRRYLSGAPEPDPAVGAAWRTWIRGRAAAGRTVRSLRVLRGRPTDYQLYELDWGYRRNIAAGMEGRVLDLTEQPAPAGFLNEEFWLLDRRRAIVLDYDEQGAFRSATAVEGPSTARYVVARDVAWTAAIPFTTWWAQHPEHHRGRRGCA